MDRFTIEVIGRYPFMGVGFTGTPEIDIYANVANMYLMMANQIGLTGVIHIPAGNGRHILLTAAAPGVSPATMRISPRFTWAITRRLFTALVNAVADLYFFRLDFQSSITWFWLIVALCIASSKLA